MVEFLETKMGIWGFRGCEDLLPDAGQHIWSKVWIRICQWKNVIFSMDSMANSIFVGDVRILNLELYVKNFLHFKKQQIKNLNPITN